MTIYYIKMKSHLSVCLSVYIFPHHANNSVISTLDLVCVIAVSSGTSKFVFYKSVSALCLAHEHLKGTAVALFCHVLICKDL